MLRTDKIKLIKDLRGKKYTFRLIGELLGVSAQMVSYLYRHKLTPRVRLLGRPDNSFKGRERTREMVRIRDGHTCQDCGKRWQPGSRRFDVHHLNGLCGLKSRKYDRVEDIITLITYCHKCHLGNHVDKAKMGARSRLVLSTGTTEMPLQPARKHESIHLMPQRKRENANTLIRIYPKTRTILKRIADRNRITMAEVVDRLALLNL